MKPKFCHITPMALFASLHLHSSSPLAFLHMPVSQLQHDMISNGRESWKIGAYDLHRKHCGDRKQIKCDLLCRPHNKLFAQWTWSIDFNMLECLYIYMNANFKHAMGPTLDLIQHYLSSVRFSAFKDLHMVIPQTSWNRRFASRSSFQNKPVNLTMPGLKWVELETTRSACSCWQHTV